MSRGNTPGSATPDPKEAKEPPDFASHPQEAYDFACSVLEESIAAKEKNKAKYAESNTQNKKLRSFVHEKIEQIESLESTVSTLNTENGILGDRDKSASKVPPYNGTEGGSSTRLWVDNLEKLQGVHKWSDDQTLEAGRLAPSGIAGSWRVNEKEDDQPSNSDLTVFKAAFLNRFSIQTSTVKNVKAMADLEQGPAERVVDCLERCRIVVTAWGCEHKAAYTAAQQNRTAGFQDCLTLCIKQQFVAGLKPAIRKVIESKYASLTARTLLLKATREAEISVSTGRDKRIMEIEAELSKGAGRGSSPGRGRGQAEVGRGRGP